MLFQWLWTCVGSAGTQSRAVLLEALDGSRLWLHLSVCLWDVWTVSQQSHTTTCTICLFVFEMCERSVSSHTRLRVQSVCLSLRCVNGQSALTHDYVYKIHNCFTKHMHSGNVLVKFANFFGPHIFYVSLSVTMPWCCLWKIYKRNVWMMV